MEDSKAMEDMAAMATMEITQQVIMDMGAAMTTVSIDLEKFLSYPSVGVFETHEEFRNACLHLLFSSLRPGQRKLRENSKTWGPSE